MIFLYKNLFFFARLNRFLHLWVFKCKNGLTVFHFFQNMLWSRHFLYEGFPFSFNLLRSCASFFFFLRDTHYYLHSHVFFLECLPLCSFLCSFCCEISSKRRFLLLICLRAGCLKGGQRLSRVKGPQSAPAIFDALEIVEIMWQSEILLKCFQQYYLKSVY